MKQDEFAPVETSEPERARPVIIHGEHCIGCNTCVEVCPQDVFLPNPSTGEPPVVAYPQECWHDGACVEHCPCAGAIELRHPLMQRVRWKRKPTGEHFRL
jgi:NAD-dependent dihydropyrimidine dehydrogenase PreA subunit